MKTKATNPGAFKLGRLHRTYDPRVPHMSALLAGQTLTPPPASVDWTKGMPANLGMMLNDTLGDCTCAAVYHAMQVWSFNGAGQMVTQPDSDVEKLYIQADGYNPRVPGEGPGGNEQHVLTYLLQQGAPIGPTGAASHKIAAFVEVDPRNLDDVKRTINDCGLAYIGFNVPQSVQPPGQPPPQVWRDSRRKGARFARPSGPRRGRNPSRDPARHRPCPNVLQSRGVQVAALTGRMSASLGSGFRGRGHHA